MNEEVDAAGNRPSQIFDSAIDLWIAVMLFLAPALASGAGMFCIAIGKPGDASLLFLTAAVTLAVTLGLTMPCRYTILADALSIRCGLLCYQVPLESIREVEPSSTWKSGPALSMRRVLVTTEKRAHVLSPRERDRFIQELRARMSETASGDST